MKSYIESYSFFLGPCHVYRNIQKDAWYLLGLQEENKNDWNQSPQILQKQSAMLYISGRAIS